MAVINTRSGRSGQKVFQILGVPETISGRVTLGHLPPPSGIMAPRTPRRGRRVAIPNCGAESPLQAAHVRHPPHRGDVPSALQALDAAEQLIPYSPLVPMYRSQALLLQGDKVQALELAYQAHERDLTLLPAYLALGKAALANAQYPEAIQALETYLEYASNDADGWMALARAHAGMSQPDQVYIEASRKPAEQDFQDALDAFDRAIELNEEQPELYLYRGLLYLAAGEGQPAVNDFVSARKLNSKSFATNLALGRALLVAGRARDAYDQIDGSESLAQSDLELAALYYWRAMAGEELRLDAKVVADWKALLDLPQDSLPQGWAETAEQHLLALTSTATPTVTKTVQVTPTSQASKTPTRTPTLTRTPAP